MLKFLIVILMAFVTKIVRSFNFFFQTNRLCELLLSWRYGSLYFFLFSFSKKAALYRESSKSFSYYVYLLFNNLKKDYFWSPNRAQNHEWRLTNLVIRNQRGCTHQFGCVADRPVSNVLAKLKAS